MQCAVGHIPACSGGGGGEGRGGGGGGVGARLWATVSTVCVRVCGDVA